MSFQFKRYHEIKLGPENNEYIYYIYIVGQTAKVQFFVLGDTTNSKHQFVFK